MCKVLGSGTRERFVDGVLTSKKKKFPTSIQGCCPLADKYLKNGGPLLKITAFSSPFTIQNSNLKFQFYCPMEMELQCFGGSWIYNWYSTPGSQGYV